MNDKKTSPVKRMLAAAALILMAMDIIYMFVNIASGGDTGITLMCLFFLMVIPAVIYIFIFFYNATVGRYNKDNDNSQDNRTA